MAKRTKPAAMHTLEVLIAAQQIKTAIDLVDPEKRAERARQQITDCLSDLKDALTEGTRSGLSSADLMEILDAWSIEFLGSKISDYTKGEP